MIAPNHGLTGKQLAALNLLAACPNGCTEAAMKADGFGIGYWSPWCAPGSPWRRREWCKPAVGRWAWAICEGRRRTYATGAGSQRSHSYDDQG